ncbi:hypothetical protein KR200_002228, partial [Drosophila serrata]
IALLASLLVIFPRSGWGSSEVLEPNCGKRRNGHLPQTLGPWTALLHENTRLVCIGTLIHRRFILTAAHCIREGENLQVRLGEYDRLNNDERPEDYFVDKAFRHRRYNKETLENDIGLLRLARPVQYKDHIKPICIVVDPSPDHLSWIDSSIHEFTGTAYDRPDRENFKGGNWYAINITRLRQNECQDGRTVKANLQFCGWNQKSNSSCDGPSGSPLSHVMMDSIFQFGIASHNELDCLSKRVYTNVTHFSEWILKSVYF